MLSLPLKASPKGSLARRVSSSSLDMLQTNAGPHTLSQASAFRTVLSLTTLSRIPSRFKREFDFAT